MYYMHSMYMYYMHYMYMYYMHCSTASSQPQAHSRGRQ